MSGKVIGLVVATRFEAAPLLRAFRLRRIASNLFKSQQNGQTVLLAISGIGMEPARQAAYRLCGEGAKELASVGFCGALVPGLQVGDLVTDRIATAPNAVWSRVDRQALAAKAGAQAVDMETQSIIEAGTRRGVPIRVLRVVSDQVGDDVSPLLGSNPTFSPFRIAFRLLNPLHWPTAYKLWRQSRFASRQLVEAVNSYLKEAP